jgi:hypothetical protein
MTSPACGAPHRAPLRAPGDGCEALVQRLRRARSTLEPRCSLATPDRCGCLPPVCYASGVDVTGYPRLR